MKNKKICIFSAQYLPHMGGVENYTFHLAETLVEKGGEVTVVASNVDHVKSYETMNGIHVYRVPCINLLNGRFPVLKPTGEFWKIHQILKQKNFDLIIVNTRFYIHSLYGVLFGRKKNIHTIVVEHGTSHMTMHNKLLDLVENIVEHTITMIEKLFCKEYYGVSEACLDWLEHFHIQGKGVLYNAINLEQVEAQKLTNDGKKRIRETYQIPEDGTVITFTGRLLKEKGVVTLVQAVQTIVEKNKNVFLLIAGDGDEMEFVQKASCHNIISLGRITSQEVIDLLNESDIFCLPSVSEGMPTSVLEAAACKNYVITTEKGGAKELIINRAYGTILRNRDFKSVLEALEAAIADKEMRMKATELTYERLKKGFTWKSVADKVLEL